MVVRKPIKPRLGTVESSLLRGFSYEGGDLRTTSGAAYQGRVRPDRDETIYTIALDGTTKSQICVGQVAVRINYVERPDLPKGAPPLGPPRKDFPGGGVRIVELNGGTCVTDRTLEQWRDTLLGPAVKRQKAPRRQDRSRQGRPRSTTTERPVSPTSQEGYEYWTRSKRTRAERLEAKLVEEFCSHLRALEYEPVARRTATVDGYIECDVYDRSRHILFEAKADASDRPQVRMAIGQLADYAFSGFSEAERVTLRKAILLPERPPQQIDDLLTSLGIGLAWRAGSGFVEHLDAPT